MMDLWETIRAIIVWAVRILVALILIGIFGPLVAWGLKRIGDVFYLTGSGVEWVVDSLPTVTFTYNRKPTPTPTPTVVPTPCPSPDPARVQRQTQAPPTMAVPPPPTAPPAVVRDERPSCDTLPFAKKVECRRQRFLESNQ